MKTMKDCRFCNLLNGIYKYKEVDEPVFETEYYSMICSVGAFIPGWCLIVPKQHDFSMRSCYNDVRFFKFFYKVKNLVEKTFNSRMIAFEHGANRKNSLTSCGTCHSHLHIVPFNESILDDIQLDREWIICDFSDIETVVGDREYLLYIDIVDQIEESKCYIHILEEETSQYFRKVLANKIGYCGDYSYKNNLLLDNAKHALQKYREEIENNRYEKKEAL